MTRAAFQVLVIPYRTVADPAKESLDRLIESVVGADLRLRMIEEFRPRNRFQSLLACEAGMINVTLL
jgi:hypothetical protein